MARRRTKKERKKHLKENLFRESMFTIGRQLKEYRYLILMFVAVVVLFAVLLSMRSERRQEQLSLTAAILNQKDPAPGADELKQHVEKVKGEGLEPWVLLRYGTELYELYLKEDSMTGNKERLDEARRVLNGVIADFPDNGSVTYLAGKALELIEEESSYTIPEDLKKAYEKQLPRPDLPNR